MKALSVRQPWVHQIAIGAKTYEVRSRPCHYRGPVVLVASLTMSTHPKAKTLEPGEHRGQAVCVVDLVDCVLGTSVMTREALIDPTGQWCWRVTNPRPVEPIPIKGQLAMWTLPDDTVRRLGLA